MTAVAEEDTVVNVEAEVADTKEVVSPDFVLPSKRQRYSRYSTHSLDENEWLR
jgi:hypothetical protein